MLKKIAQLFRGAVVQFVQGYVVVHGWCFELFMQEDLQNPEGVLQVLQEILHAKPFPTTKLSPNYFFIGRKIIFLLAINVRI